MAKLIEQDFPFARLSLIAKRESWRKEIYRPVYYLHKWWARRLGSVFRGIVLASCLDDSQDFWSRFYGSNSFGNTLLFDPFMGSGVTIGEAIKLGCKTIGRDINPVAYLACRAAFAQYKSSEVISVYKGLERALAPKLLSYFDTLSSSGEKATVLYYFLVKVVTCPECSKKVDLFKTRIFSKNAVPRKDPSARASCPGCGGVTLTRYDAQSAVCPVCSLSFNPQDGNITGAHVRCDGCGASFRLVDRMQSVEGPLGFRRHTKMILTKQGDKRYECLNEFDRALQRRVADEFQAIAQSFPIVEIESGYNTNQMLKHNYRHWHELFSDRQLVCIRQMIDAIKEIEQPDIRLLFACLLSGTLEFNNLFTSFKGEGTGAVRHMFSHHVLRPEMMPLEANLWGTSKSSGAFSRLFHSRVERALAYKSEPTELQLNSSKSTKIAGINHPIAVDIVDSFSDLPSRPETAYLSVGDSSRIDIPDNSVDLVVTDPPFFDNVHYSQLADFFYYWLNQMLAFSSKTTTRRRSEVQDTDAERFTEKLTSVFAECRRVLRKNGLLVFTYHHSRHEGWTAVHQAIRRSGFVCIQTYPIKAEMSVSMPLQQARSPIHLDLILVCRKDVGRIGAEPESDTVVSALCQAEQQVSSLKGIGIKVSLGDAKVVLMGQFLREAHKMRDPKREENLLKQVEKEIDEYVGQVTSTKGEVLYAKAKPQQLALFEEMVQYLVRKHMSPMTNPHG